MIRTFQGPARLAAVLVGALLPLAAGGCSFDRNWKRLAAQPTTTTTAAPGNELSGRWEGTWKSERNSHAGKLRAIITPVDDTTYRADFDATYLGILRFGYALNLAAQRDGDIIRFQGQENLGWLAGGLYRYDGAADGRTFDCAYQSKSDHGRFRMTRPAPSARGQEVETEQN